MSNSELLACRERIERVARAIYESIFVDEWLGGASLEAARSRQAAQAAIEAIQLDELRAERRMLLDLLAIIHRDGGQYVDTHGLEKAWQDAISLSAELRAENERLVGAFREVKAALSLTTLVEDLDGVRECIAEIKSRIDRHISKAL